MSTTSFTIGNLSGETGVNIETIRYYERIGLMAKPPRSEGGRRLYDEPASRRLNFIRRSRELGFSIEEIRA
ncbi:MAG: MerR family transcriptional regulator, partial [Bryobacteraceae bacterium]